jgi:hypothetical protein
MAIDEASRRREEFQEASAPVVLADGQTWHIPKPFIAIFPSFVDGRAVNGFRHLTYGPDLDAHMGAIREEEEPIDRLLLVLTLGAYLLRRNYDLTDDELDELFVYRMDDEQSAEMVKAILDVAAGRGKKASSGGDS